MGRRTYKILGAVVYSRDHLNLNGAVYTCTAARRMTNLNSVRTIDECGVVMAEWITWGGVKQSIVRRASQQLFITAMASGQVLTAKTPAEIPGVKQVRYVQRGAEKIKRDVYHGHFFFF